MIDYRKLLSKYMSHVASEEGTTFVSALVHSYVTDFTPEEIAELQKIDKEDTR